MQMALELYQVLSQSDTNLRQPVRLENQLLQDQRMDSDVGKSMLQLLQVPTSCCMAATLVDYFLRGDAERLRAYGSC